MYGARRKASNPARSYVRALAIPSPEKDNKKYEVNTSPERVGHATQHTHTTYESTRAHTHTRTHELRGVRVSRTSGSPHVVVGGTLHRRRGQGRSGFWFRLESGRDPNLKVGMMMVVIGGEKQVNSQFTNGLLAHD